MIKISQDNNNYVTVEMFNAGINGVRNEIRAGNEELRREIRALERTVITNTVKIDELKNFTGLGFTIMAGVIAFIGCVMTLAPTLLEVFRSRREKKDTPTFEDVQRMIDASLKKN